ncbi:amino acid ABC transporter permease [Pediococcus acidilactici]|jgi:putative glutamine transport system permease protein|uniref:amino acid ABC transporter permease n=1 Tax=Pediococcus acidilactici TaxID=1254 RepID=UPI0009202AEE|nr:amino acid ABC transporter permease [Pediococcus acidilactici]APR27829.1 glutamine ABC transporter permease [Pediococcus acidilactici]OIM96950.1 glutamine ABC transporter permease [Pediococcus acidilactici]QIO84824.1 amino acid ABC transporter permease [Pediococcus acidilactici]QJW86303.1 amino acid ABC transporter permease [Pediococcus acidilactici]QYI95151.1 amino acid ABC transporter permease [Pediococcus acidilactici]
MHAFMEAYSAVNLAFLLKGLWITIEVSVISIIFSYVLGGILGLIRYLNVRYLSALVGVVIDVIRNLPLLLMFFFVYFGLPNLGIRLEILPSSILALTVFESAMIAEIIRGGIVSIDKGQMEGARANGLSYWQAMRYIILPQAQVRMIPALVSQFISLIKDTSLATIIMLPEMMYHAQIIYGQNTNYIIPMFVALAGMYFVVCYTLSIISRKLEKKLA